MKFGHRKTKLEKYRDAGMIPGARMVGGSMFLPNRAERRRIAKSTGRRSTKEQQHPGRVGVNQANLAKLTDAQIHYIARPNFETCRAAMHSHGKDVS